MSSLNKFVRPETALNHNGLAVKKNPDAEATLLRMTLANMLWEDQFYMDGKSTVDIIQNLIPQVKSAFVSELAKVARKQLKLRHIPLLLTRELARHGNLKADTLTDVIQRPDEMSEFLSIYWKDGKSPLSNQVKKGLAKAFNKFSEYQFAKWDKNSAAISLRDVMFLTHPTPESPVQEELFARIANKQMETPDTWETQLSAGADKKETFIRLMNENKLAALAFLRNLRNMVQADVPENLIRTYAKSLDVSKVLPFRYIAAARHVPQLEDMLEEMMFRGLEKREKLPGKTVLLVDISGSMFGAKVSSKSELDRFDAAVALAILAREICEEVEIWTFSNRPVRVTPRRGFALAQALRNSQQPGGTDTRAAVAAVRGSNYDRIVIFTDEQSHTRIGAPNKGAKGYVVNVAAYQHGINYTDWVNITGFSEAVMDYILASEKEFELFFDR